MPITVDPNLIKHFKNQEEFRKWLSQNFNKPEGIWLKLFKKSSGIQSISHDQALDIALCFGWIDGVAKKLDDENSWVQKFTPRRAKSLWSKRNIQHTQRLIKLGLMTDAGLKEIELAKKDGRWENAYDTQADFILPEDFLIELKKDKKAKDFFAKLNKANKFAIYWRLHTAKKPETREKRMKQFLEMLSKEQKLY